MKNRTRLLAGLLSLLLLFTSMPAAALAGETETFVPTKKAKDGTLVGDVNKNNAVDATDRMILARYLAGWEGYEERILSMDAADIDRDGDVNAKDRMLLARFLAGWDGYEEYFTGYLVTFDGNSFDVENLPEPQNVKPGECAAEPTAPTKPIHVFTGWYTDEECTAKFDFSTPVTDNLTLYAGWECEIYCKEPDDTHIKTGIIDDGIEESEIQYTDNQIIIVIDKTCQIDDLIKTILNGAEVVGQIPDIGYYQIELSEALDITNILDLCDSCMEHPEVMDCYPNYISELEEKGEILNNGYNNISFTSENKGYKLFSESGEVPWDAYDIRNWHLSYTKIDKARSLIKDIKHRSTITVGVIDTMFDLNHEDLTFNDVWYIQRPDSDNSFIFNDPDIVNTDNKDLFGHYIHGTHVAGIIGAENNGIGISGVCDDVQLNGFSLHFKGDNNFSVAYKPVISFYGMETAFATTVKSGCRVINYSIGSALNLFGNYPNPKRTAEKLYDEMKAFNELGYDYIVVTAAGNEAHDAQKCNEFCYLKGNELYADVHKQIIVVSGVLPTYERVIDGNNTGEFYYHYGTNLVNTDSTHEKMTRNVRFYNEYNYGECVDILAPCYILSTVPKTNDKGFSPTGYSAVGGTSMASPVVAGVAALIYSVSPEFSAEKVYDCIISTADHCAQVQLADGKTVTDAFLDAEAAVKVAITEYYTVKFDANTGGGTMEDQSIEVVITGDFTFPECGFTPPDNCIFKCWRFNDKDYAPGDTMTVNGGGSGTAQALWTSPVHGDRIYRGSFGDYVKWMLFQDGTMIVSGNGGMRGYDEARYRPYLNCLDLITSVVIQDGVTSVGQYVFCGCKNMTSVSIPESVTRIYRSAFSGCTSLESVTIPKTVTYIGEWAFANCKSLTSLTLHIGTDRAAFQNCTSLKNVTFLDTVKSIGYQAFNGCTALTSVTIPDSVTTIRMHAFDGCTALTSVTIPASITTWEMLSFFGCKSLTSVTLKNGLTKIGDSAFMSCTSLTDILIPNSVKSISEDAFYNTGLTSVTIPSSVTYVGDAVFYECQSLQSIRFMGSAPTFGSETFGGLNRVGVTATAYYPANDASWTEDVRKDYGGHITWVAYEP